MRKVGYIAALGLLTLPFAADANAEDGKVYYKKNDAVFEFPEVKMKLDTRVRVAYIYEDFEDSDLRGEPDTSGVDVRRARIGLSGTALDGMWEFKVQNNFTDDAEADDAWLQYNHSDAAALRMGQFKEPFSRQEQVSSDRQQLVRRSIATDFFARGRDRGLMAHGDLSDMLSYAIGGFNGESDGEGVNSDAVDNNVKGVAQLVFTCGEYGSRSIEGDHRDTDTLGVTAGVSAAYGEGEVAGVNFEDTYLNGDIGLRAAGASLQGEYFYKSSDPDGGSSIDQNGFYVQAGMMMGDWEPAVRYGFVDPDEVGGVDDYQEYSVALNHFFNGHALKATAGVTFLIESPVGGGGDTTDTRAELQLTADI